jgi:hypothetical protein
VVKFIGCSLILFSCEGLVFLASWDLSGYHIDFTSLLHSFFAIWCSMSFASMLNFDGFSDC